jgi:hypothetical protein
MMSPGGCIWDEISGPFALVDAIALGQRKAHDSGHIAEDFGPENSLHPAAIPRKI